MRWSPYHAPVRRTNSPASAAEPGADGDIRDDKFLGIRIDRPDMCEAISCIRSRAQQRCDPSAQIQSVSSLREAGMQDGTRTLRTRDFLRLIGVDDAPPCTSPFDPGYDPATVESHLDQSAHLMASLKISMACWLIAEEHATRRKITAARAHNVPTVTGGGPFEIAAA